MGAAGAAGAAGEEEEGGMEGVTIGLLQSLEVGGEEAVAAVAAVAADGADGADGAVEETKKINHRYPYIHKKIPPILFYIF